MIHPNIPRTTRKTERELADQLLRLTDACWQRPLPELAEGDYNFRNEYGLVNAISGTSHIAVSADRASDRYSSTIETEKVVTDLSTGFEETTQVWADFSGSDRTFSLYVEGNYPGEVTGYLNYECIVDGSEGTVTVCSHGRTVEGLADEEITDLAEKITVSAQIVAAIRAAISDVRTAHNTEPTNIS